MHLPRKWLASLATVVCLAGLANAQCCPTWPIPRAPDMCGPGYYYWNCQGYLYGPYHNVYPCFPPHNGFIPGPSGGGGAQANQHFMAAMQAYQKRGMMPGYSAIQQQMGQQQPGGYPGFWTHPAVRSPRDFFMYGDDPASSPYRYGGAGGSPSTTDRVVPSSMPGR